MTEGGKKALKQTGDHNWDLERMQFEKDKGNISNEQDYVNKQTKQRDIQAALNRVRTIKRESTQIEKNLNYLFFVIYSISVVSRRVLSEIVFMTCPDG